MRRSLDQRDSRFHVSSADTPAVSTTRTQAIATGNQPDDPGSREVCSASQSIQPDSSQSSHVSSSRNVRTEPFRWSLRAILCLVVLLTLSAHLDIGPTAQFVSLVASGGLSVVGIGLLLVRWAQAYRAGRPASHP